MVDTIRVLHVDDDPQFAEMTAEFLERESARITVECETDPAAGLTQVRSGEVDCVVSDYEMPDMDGIEFLEAVRERDGTVPFILYTGKGSEEVASEALAKGATDYLQKAAGSDRYALLANRIENAVIQARSVTELQRQSEILDEAQEMANLGVTEYDPESGEAWLSSGMFSVFGFPRPESGHVYEDVSIEDTLAYYHPDDRDAVRAAIERADADGEATDLEARSADDPDRWVAVRIRPRTDGEAVDGIRATIQDITAQKRREETLRRQERRFEAVFEDPEMLVAVLDADGRLREANETSLAYVDADLAALRGEPFPQTPWWPDDRRADVRAWLDRAADGEYVTYDADLTRADGTHYSITGSVRPVTDDEGSVESFVVSGRDVTERKERERELERYQRLIEEFGESVFVTNRAVEHVHVNPAGERISGYDAEELVGSSADLLYSEAEFERLVAAVADLIEDEERAIATVEAAMQTKDGDEIPVEITMTVRYDEDGEFAGTVGVARDLRERKTIERELQEAESIMRAIPDEVTILNTDGEITRIIPPTGSATTVSGYDPDEIEGEHISTVMPDEHVEHGVEVIEELVTTDRERAAFEMEVLTRDGQTHWRENHLALLKDEDGTIEGTVGVLRDIEERKAYEQELERQNARLERFAEIASHDLRNPLNLAQGYMEMVDEECDSEHVEQVVTALDRMAVLIDDTLAMARQGADVADRTEVDLAALAPTCWEAVGPDSASLAVADPPRVIADENRLKQVIENLLRNAVEHGGEDVTVEIGAIGSDGDETASGFYVEDDGPGIPPGERDSVFDAGFTTDSEGTGFGLAIVGEILEAHGWEVDVTESEMGGARFEITGVEPSQMD